MTCVTACQLRSPARVSRRGSSTSFCSLLLRRGLLLEENGAGMDSNGWYSTPNGMNGYGRDAYLSPDPTSSRTDGMAVDSVADSHQLLSAYPLASLNPTGHGQGPYNEIGSAVT